MIATVSLERLDRINLGKDESGKRIYATHIVTSENFEAIAKCVLTALGINNLTIS